MKFCNECGNQLSSQHKFCTKCGKPVTYSEEEEKSNTENEDGKEHKSNPNEKTSNSSNEPITPLQNGTVELKKYEKLPEVSSTVEGHYNTEVDLKNEQIRPDSASSDRSVKKGNHPGRKVPKWIIGISAAIILLIAGVVGVLALNDNNEENVKVAVTEPKEEADTKPPSISEEEVASLFPNWVMIKQEIVNIDGTYYTLLAIGQNEIEFEESVKIAIIDFDGTAQDNKWHRVWESEEFYADPIINIESYIGDFYLVNPEDATVALVVFNVMHSGTARTYDTYAFQVGVDGKGEVAWSGTGSSIEVTEDFIEVMEHGAVHISVSKDTVEVSEIPRSEVGSENAVRVEFTLNSEGQVVPTKDEEIYVKTGQAITFVPSDSKTKSLFDNGDINLYYNSMEYGPITTANVNLVYTGNEFTFDTEGSYGFLLDYYSNDTNAYTPPYTFIVHAGNGEKPITSETEENVPAASSEIVAPFSLDTTLSVLKAHYGEPSYDDYYSGARLVMFDNEGYFIDDMEETVIGYYFAAPTISVFGATVGMTGDEINSLYSENEEPFYDENETQMYAHVHYKNGYKIFFYSEEENGPTSSVWLVRE